MAAVFPSRYNYEFINGAGESLICNGLSGTMIRNTEGLLETTSPENQNFLIKHNFLVPVGQSEFALLSNRNRELNHNQKRMELTLMLHENCNFRCTYCFEDFKNKKFEGVVIEELLQFVNTQLAEGGELYVHFYGGEPLLSWSSLTQIHEALAGIATSKNCHYCFFITSNGSLLDRSKSEYLHENHIAHIKVTLDGPPQIHNQRRKGVRGQETFDEIFRNVAQAADLFKVIIRVNLDNGNVCHISSLLELIQQSFSERALRNVYFDYNIVWNPCSGALENDISYDSVYDLQKATLERGLKLSLPELTRFRHCKFNSSNSYLINTSGEAFLCSVSEETKISKLSELAAERHGTIEAPVAKAFHAIRDACVNCNLLPICGGGCTILALRNGKPPCPPWKDSYKKYLSIQSENSELRKRQTLQNCI